MRNAQKRQSNRELTPEEMRETEEEIIRLAQREAFREEYLVLKGNSTVKTSWAQIKDNTFNKFFPKYLGPNHISKGEIVRQSSRIFQISTPCCSFRADANWVSGRICDVIACFDTCCSRIASVFILQFIMNVDILTSSSSGESLSEFHGYILEGGEVLGYQFEPRIANSVNGESAETIADQNMSTDEEESSVCLGNLDW